MCQAAQGIMAAVPARVHGLPPATLTECSCIANDDDWCQWDITWKAEPSDGWARRIWSRGGSRPAMPEGGSPLLSSVQMDALLPTAGLQSDAKVPQDHRPLRSQDVTPSFRDSSLQRHALSQPAVSKSKTDIAGYVWALSGAALTSGIVRLVYPSMSLGEVLLAGLIPVLVAGTWINWRLRKESQRREALIQEQINFVESRHEELREAYLEQEHTRVELRRTVNHLTALHQAGLLFSSTLDREALLEKVLETLIHDLHFDRAMISFYDPVRGMTTDARVAGV
jgi:hypothetical protein